MSEKDVLMRGHVAATSMLKVDDEMKQCLNEFVDKNCLGTSKNTPSKASRTRQDLLTVC